MTKSVVLMCVGVVLALAGCAGSTAAVTPRSSAAALPPITVRRTGGLAGTADMVTVDPHGAWIATDRTGHRRAGRLTADQVAAVDARAGDPRLAAEARRSVGPTRCADAVSYDVTVATVRVTYVDCPTDPDPPTATIALVQLVRQDTG